jgi:hypothetical protein
MNCSDSRGRVREYAFPQFNIHSIDLFYSPCSRSFSVFNAEGDWRAECKSEPSKKRKRMRKTARQRGLSHSALVRSNPLLSMLKMKRCFSFQMVRKSIKWNRPSLPQAEPFLRSLENCVACVETFSLYAVSLPPTSDASATKDLLVWVMWRTARLSEADHRDENGLKRHQPCGDLR